MKHKKIEDMPEEYQRACREFGKKIANIYFPTWHIVVSIIFWLLLMFALK